MHAGIRYRDGRWIRERRLTAAERKRGVVVEDVTAAVQLAAVRALLSSLVGKPHSHTVRAVDAAAAAALLTGTTGRTLTVALGWSIEEFSGTCIRLVRS